MVRLTPYDKVLIAFLLSLCVLLLWHPIHRRPGKMVVVQVHGEEMGRFPLAVQRELWVQGPLGQTRVVIDGGKVWVAESPCPHKRCVQMGRKWRAGDLLVCIPNRVVVRIVGEEGGNYDAIVQ